MKVKENILIDNGINKVCRSSDMQFIYVVTERGLFVLNSQNKQIEAKVEIDYGAQDVVELSSGLIAVSTWSGIRIFEIVRRG